MPRKEAITRRNPIAIVHDAAETHEIRTDARHQAQARLLGCCSSTTISSATATTWAEAAAAQRTSAIVMNNFFM
jgi:hypothetical protein